MTRASSLIKALDEGTIAMEVLPFDECREGYRLPRNTVRDWGEFDDIITDFTISVNGHCISPGGRLSTTNASEKAKSTLEQFFRHRRRSDIVEAFNNARDNVNNGLRGILDILIDQYKQEAIEAYIRQQFDSRVAPHDFEAKVDLIREIFHIYGSILSDSIQLNRPERYAHDYVPLVRALTEGLRETSAMFRRL